MTDKTIKHENWYVKVLASKVLNGEIYKPKFQRKRKWDSFPKNNKVPNEREYIEYLFGTYNSVDAITFGTYNDKLSNIDGNNRINAIMRFLKVPFMLFPEKIDDLKKFIEEKINHDVANQVEQIIKEMTYDELMQFRYSKFFIDKGFEELYNKHLKMVRDELEIFFDELINKMKINNKDRFDNDVIIHVSLFSGYNTEELADLFAKINKYKSALTEQEALASRLFNISKFEIEDKTLEHEIKENIRKYYDERTNDEELICYVYNKDDVINAYDFMVGFQNYAHSKCDLIYRTDHKNDKDGLSLFFKIFKNLYKGSLDNSFTTENVNDFITYITKTIDILQKLKTTIFVKNLTGSNSKIFDAANKKLNSLKKNNLYLIITSIIGYIKNKTQDNDILKSIEKCVLYHFFITSIDDKEKRDQYKLYDGILYEAGGAFIDNKAKEYLKSPQTISCKITKIIMSDLLNVLIQENIKNKCYDDKVNGRKYKRRARQVHELILIYYYYICKVPTQFLKNNFWVEHLFPFSCKFEDEIDIDRLGNIFPILESLNKERSNKHISEYNDNTDFLKYIDIIPSNKKYDEIVSHKNKKPCIIDNEKYNDYCSNNEKKLIDCFLQKLFC